MAINTRNLEWLNHNATRKYPIVADIDCTDTTGTFVIPDDFLVSLYLAVSSSAGFAPAGFYIKSIGAYTAGYGIVIGYGTESVAVANVTRAGHTLNKAYRLNGLGNYADCAGTVTIGTLTTIDAQPPGQFNFEESHTRLETDCVRPNIRNVPSIRCQNGTTTSAPIYNNIVIRAGTNCRVTADTSQNPTVITIDAIEGAGLTETCVCGTGGSSSGVPICTINGIPPTPDGDFTFQGSTCLSLTPIEHGLQLADTCAQPCCSCPELEPIVSALETLRTQIIALEQLATTLEGRASALDSNLFASTLGDGGCRSC